MNNKRGFIDLSFGGFFIIFLIIAGIWTGYHYAVAMYEDTQVQTTLQTGFIQTRLETNDALIKERVIKDLKEHHQIDINEKDVVIMRSGDAKKITLRVSYVRKIEIPFIGKTWDIAFNPELEESSTRGQ